MGRLTRFLPVLRSICHEILAEFRDKALRGPGASFTKSTYGSPGDIIGYRLQSVGISFGARPVKQTRSDLLHPKRSFPARRALAATFVGVEFINVVQGPDHVAGIIHHNDSSGSGHRSDCRQGVEVDPDVVHPYLFFNGGSIRLLGLDLVTVVCPQHFGGAAPRDDGFQFAPRTKSSTNVVDELAHGKATGFELVVAWLLDISAHAKQPGAGVIRPPNLCVLGAAHLNDVLNVA